MEDLKDLEKEAEEEGAALNFPAVHCELYLCL